MTQERVADLLHRGLSGAKSFSPPVRDSRWVHSIKSRQYLFELPPTESVIFNHSQVASMRFV